MHVATIAYLDALTRLSPAFGTARAETVAYWAPDAPPTTILFAEQGEAIVDNLSQLDQEDRDALFAMIDEGMNSADEELSTAVATGFVEGAIGRADRSGHLDELLAALGPAAHAHAKAWIGGGAPPAGTSQSGDDPLSKPITTPTSYDVIFRLMLGDGGQLIAFDSFPRAGVLHQAISGREVFRFDAGGRALWQITPEEGTTEARTHPFDPAIKTDEPFVNIWDAHGDIYTSRMNGDTFLIDMETGSASYSGWART